MFGISLAQVPGGGTTTQTLPDPGAVNVGCDPGQAGIDLSDCLTLGRNGQTVAEVYTQPADIVNIIVRNLFILSGIIILFLIIYAGYQFIAKNAKGVDEAKSIMTAAVAGLVVMFVAYWIIKILETILGMPLLTF